MKITRDEFEELMKGRCSLSGLRPCDIFDSEEEARVELAPFFDPDMVDFMASGFEVDLASDITREEMRQIVDETVDEIRKEMANDGIR